MNISIADQQALAEQSTNLTKEDIEQMSEDEKLAFAKRFADVVQHALIPALKELAAAMEPVTESIGAISEQLAAVGDRIENNKRSQFPKRGKDKKR